MEVTTQMGVYSEQYQRGISDPEGFWAAAATALTWYEEPSHILDDTRAPFYRWFPDGRINTCFNALDRHVDAATATVRR